MFSSGAPGSFGSLGKIRCGNPHFPSCLSYFLNALDFIGLPLYIITASDKLCLFSCLISLCVWLKYFPSPSSLNQEYKLNILSCNRLLFLSLTFNLQIYFGFSNSQIQYFNSTTIDYDVQSCANVLARWEVFKVRKNTYKNVNFFFSSAHKVQSERKAKLYQITI